MTKFKNLKFLAIVLFLGGFFLLNSANTCENKKEDQTEHTEGEHPTNNDEPTSDEHPSNGDDEHPDN